MQRGKRNPVRAWGTSLTKSGVEFIEFDRRVEAAHQHPPRIANDRRKDVGVEEIADKDKLQPI